MYKLISILQSDKATHLMICYLITTLLPWYYIGAVVAFSLGLYKEYRDYIIPSHTASVWDMVANMAGIGLGLIQIKYIIYLTF